MTQLDIHKPTTVRVLVIAHDAALSTLISESFIAYDPVFKVSTVASMRDAARSITACSPDVVVVSNRMPDGNGYSVLVANGRSENYPLIVVAETEEVEDAVAAMKSGASDYVVMSGYNVATLPLTVTRVVNEWRRLIIERREREFDRRAAQIVESLPELVGMADSRSRIMYVNSAGREMIGEALLRLGLKSFNSHEHFRTLKPLKPLLR